ncbi:hypothetical protein ACMD2_18674 [Ananas comosus]|uniref:Uncharacterized protein n=1 Tax=Ananas comosus TaxID=4615 RepID=A0A199USV3_ANACO|nr:hypothetical protein ACMD2_18674 [Ananas comosus]
MKFSSPTASPCSSPYLPSRRQRRRRRVFLVFSFFVVRAFLLLHLPVAGQVERAVDVLDDDDRLAGRLDEELAQLGVGLHGGQLEVVDVVVEELAMARSFVDLPVRGARTAEGDEVVDDLALLAGHGEVSKVDGCSKGRGSTATA